MAVQAPQYPWKPIVSPDFLFTEGSENMLEAMDGNKTTPVYGGVIISGEQLNQTAVNASWAKKRSREDLVSMFQSTTPAAAPVPNVQSRLLESAGASTSGRSAAEPASSLLQPFHYGTDADNLLRQHSERLRLGLEQLYKRHCRILLSEIEKQYAAKLQEKESELQGAIQWNLKLEDKARQLSAEKDLWFTAARNSDAIVSGLKASLEQALRATGGFRQMKQHGLAGGSEIGYLPEDEGSCCFQGGDGKRKALAGGGDEEVGESHAAARRRGSSCRVCKDKDVCVLLLPCRHLCLCSDCASTFDTCPVCSSPKNASLRVIIPASSPLR